MSPKHQLYADRSSQLEARGISRRNAMLLVANQTAVPLDGEWIEAFWCQQCEETKWYHVRKRDNRTYEISVAPSELWQQATGVIAPEGNPSVGEFTRRQARFLTYKNINDYKFMG